MGIAYRAWDIARECVVVLKHPRNDLLGTSGLLERFDREIRSAASLSHPHVIPVIDYGVDDGMPFLVMPFLPGGSLLTRTGRDAKGRFRPMKPPRFHLWLPAIAAGLDHAHARGIIHRDVKPANILFDAGWHPFLGDFGLAQIVCDPASPATGDALTQMGVVPGTTRFIAPERLCPGRAFDGRADQFSLAVSVYELASGGKAFPGTRTNVVDEILNHDPVPLRTLVPTLPESFCAAVQRGLAKSPNDRFGSCEAFAEAALHDIPRAYEDASHLRMICPGPGCDTLLKLTLPSVGVSLQCPCCHAQLSVAKDLTCLELPTDRHSGREVVVGLSLGQVSEFRGLYDPASTQGDSRPSAALIDQVPKASGVASPVAVTPDDDSQPNEYSQPVDSAVLIIRAVLAGLSFVAVVLFLLVLIGKSPPPETYVDPDTAIWVDPGDDKKARLVVMSPMGWSRESQEKGNLVKFMPDTQQRGLAVVVKAVPHVATPPGASDAEVLALVMKSLVADEEAKVVEGPAPFPADGDTQGLMWGVNIRDAKDSMPSRKRCFGVVVGGRVYVVEAWAVKDQFVGKQMFTGLNVDTIQAAEAVARNLSSPKPIQPLPRQSGKSWANALGMKFLFAKGGRGSFRIASSVGHTSLYATVAKPVLIGSSPVTRGQWRAVTGEQGPWKDTDRKDSRRFADGLSLEQALKFCEALTTLERAAGFLAPPGYYTLPNEVQFQLRGNLNVDPQVPEWRQRGYADAGINTMTAQEGGAILCRDDGTEEKQGTAGGFRVILAGAYEGEQHVDLHLSTGLTALFVGRDGQRTQCRVASVDLNDPLLAAQTGNVARLTVTWTAFLWPRFTDDYTFFGDRHGGRTRVILDGKTIVDAWEPGTTFASATAVHMTAGTRHTIEIQYERGPADLAFDLKWKGERLQPEENLPGVQMTPR